MDKKSIQEKIEKLEKELLGLVNAANLQIARYEGAIETLKQLLAEEKQSE